MATADLPFAPGGATIRRLPRPARLPLRGLGLAACAIVAACLAWSLPMLADGWGAAWQPIALAAALILAQRFETRLPLGRHHHTISPAESALAAGLFWLPPPVVVLAVALGVAVGQQLAGGPTIKRLVNTAQYTVAAGAAAAVATIGMLGAPGPPGAHFPRMAPSRLPDAAPTVATRWCVVVLLAMAGFFLVNHTLVVLVTSLTGGPGPAQAWRRVVPPALANWAANTANGLLGAVLVVLEPMLAPIVAGSVALTALSSRAWASSLARRNEDLHRAAESERRTEEAKADFVASISHELRSPLTPIKGFLLTLLREDRRFAEERRRDYYRLMLGQTERLEALIEDLLDVTQMETGVDVPQATPVDAKRVVERAVARFAGAAGAGGEEAERPAGRRPAPPARPITVRVPDQPVTVRADPLRAEQVLGHLLSNAVRYSPEGSPVEVGLRLQGGEVVFDVRDAGPGIPADEQARIFERFHRGGHYMTREPGGAGLGLYLAKRLVEAMGGRIWVNSTPGRGSTFSFALRGDPGGAGKPTAAPAEPCAPRSTPRSIATGPTR